MKINQKGFASIIVIVAVVVLASIAYFIFVKDKPVVQQLTPAPVTTETNIPTSSPTRSPDLETSLGNKDATGVLASFADSVTLRVEGTSCCWFTGEGNPWSPAEVKDYLLNYVKNSRTFNFSQDQTLVARMRREDLKIESLQEYIIGIGDDETVVMYRVNAEGKVSDVYLVRSYKLLITE